MTSTWDCHFDWPWYGSINTRKSPSRMNKRNSPSSTLSVAAPGPRPAAGTPLLLMSSRKNYEKGPLLETAPKAESLYPKGTTAICTLICTQRSTASRPHKPAAPLPMPVQHSAAVLLQHLQLLSSTIAGLDADLGVLPRTCSYYESPTCCAHQSPRFIHLYKAPLPLSLLKDTHLTRGSFPSVKQARALGTHIEQQRRGQQNG